MKRRGSRTASRRVAMKAAWLLLVAGTAAGGSRTALAQDFVEQIQAGPKHEWFGYSLVTDGTTLVAGDPQYTNTGHSCSSGYGAVNIFKKSGTSWPTTPSQTFTFTPDATDTEENNYGHFLSLANNVLVVSSERDDDANGSVPGAGSFFVYRRASPTANFAQIGRVYSPVPQNTERFTSFAGVATNGTYVAAAETPQFPNANRVFVYQIQGNTVPALPTVTITLPTDSHVPPNKMFITTNNTLVVLDSGAATPFAYKLNGAATPVIIDMSGSLTTFGATTPYMAGDGNSVVIMKLNNFMTEFYYPQVLTFGTAGLTTVSTLGELPLAYFTAFPEGFGPSTLTFKENQGFFVAYGSSSPGPNAFILGYKYFGGQYYPGGIVRSDFGDTFPQASFGSALAFDGTDLFVGDTSLNITNQGTDPCVSPPARGAIDVFHTVNTSGTGPSGSVKLQPWLSSTIFDMGLTTATNGQYVLSGSANDVDATISHGEMTLFENVGGVWQQVVKYTDAWDGVGGLLSFTGFGASADIDAGFIAIGAPAAANFNNLVQTGAVYVSNGLFQSGPYLSEIDPPTSAPAGTAFGQSVALTGSILVVGAPAATVGGTGLPTRGSAYVFNNSSGAWTQTQQLLPTLASGNDHEGFGDTVDASGNNVIVGIPSRNGTQTAAGAVQIFTVVNGSYVSGGEFRAPNNFPAQANFGASVSIGADYAVASSRQAGAVVVYRRTGNTWVQDTVIAPGTFNFGSAVALEGTRFAVGSASENRVYRYERINNVWRQTGILTSSTQTNTFGWTLDIKNGTLAIGDFGAKTGAQSTLPSGAAYVIGITAF
jgi:hypothetical protein